MGRRRTTTTETAPTTETTTTTTSGGMDGGGGGMDGGGGGGGGMGGGACYVYPNSPATPGIVTPDVTYTLTVDMNIPLTMDDGNTVNMWGFSGSGGGMMGGGMGGTSGMGGSSATVLTIRAKKSDVDAFAGGQQDFEQFRRKVQIFTY